MSLWDLLALFKSTLCPKIWISLADFPIQLSQGIRTNKLTLRNLTSWESRCSSVTISQACLVKHFALCKKYKNVSVIVQFSRNSSCHFHILKWNSRYHNCVCYQEWRILGNLNSMHAFSIMGRLEPIWNTEKDNHSRSHSQATGRTWKASPAAWLKPRTFLV